MGSSSCVTSFLGPTLSINSPTVVQMRLSTLGKCPIAAEGHTAQMIKKKKYVPSVRLPLKKTEIVLNIYIYYIYCANCNISLLVCVLILSVQFWGFCHFI